MKSNLIKDTTREERIEIIEDIYTICSLDNEDNSNPKTLGEASGLSPFARQQYELYINGIIELDAAEKYITERWSLLKAAIKENGENHINIDKFIETGVVELC